jgi:hypothetical protein
LTSGGLVTLKRGMSVGVSGVGLRPRTRRFLLFFAHLIGEAVSDEHDSSRDQANPGVMNNMGSTQFLAAIRA